MSSSVWPVEALGGVAPIVAALEEEIVSSRWAAGSKLPSERSLAQMLGVSRPVVREALQVLSERGLIQIVAARGSFVLDHKPTDNRASAELLARKGEVTASHLIVARTMLETQAAELAAVNRTDADLARMRQLLDAFAGASVVEAAEIDLAFHEAIAMASYNPVIQVMFGAIRTLTHGVILRSLTDRHVTGEAVPLHDVIFEAIAAKDAEGAAKAMTAHLGSAKKFYGRDLDVPLAGVLDQRADLTPGLAADLRRVSQMIQTEASEPYQTVAERVAQAAQNGWRQSDG